jgi:hypothetical protein
VTDEVVELTNELRSVKEMLRAVLGRLDSMDRQAKADRQLVQRERAKSRLHRFGSTAVLLLVIATTFLGYREYREQERLERRRCETVNETRTNTRHAIVESVLEIGRHSSNPDRVAEIADRLDLRLAEVIPLVDCRNLEN